MSGSRQWSLWAIVLLGLLVRAAAILRGPAAFDDPDNYLPLARSLLAGDGFAWKGRPTAYRPPLYPLMLAPVTAIAGRHLVEGIAVLHLVLGAGTILLTAVAAKGSGLTPPRVWLAAVMTACDPVLVWQSRSLMTETPTAFLLAGALAAMTRRGWPGLMLGGLGLGLASLCRPSMLACGGLIIVGSLLANPGTLGQRLLRASLLAATILVVFSPWIIRNIVVFGEPILMTTHGGYTLALANNPAYYHDVLHGPSANGVWTGENQWRWWDSVNRATAGMTEPEADHYMRRSAWQTIRECPVDFATATVARVEHFWSIAPAASVYSRRVRWTTMAWTLPLWLAALSALPRRELWRWPQIGAPLAAIGLSLVHTLFWTDLRMRAPIVPAIALIAAGATLPRWMSLRLKAAKSDQVNLDV